MVYAFGDSFTDKNCIRGEDTRLELGYQDYVAKHFNTNVKSIAFPGCSCSNVINFLTSRVYKMNQGDTVLVLLPPFDRKDYPSSTDLHYQKLVGDQRKKYGDRSSMETLQGFPMWSAVHQYLKNLRNIDFVNKRFSNIDYIKNSPTEDLDTNLDTLFKFLVLSNSHKGLHEENYYLTWFSNLGLFFLKNKITFKVYTFEWWDYIRDLSSQISDENIYPECECRHWNEFEHELFSKQILKDIHTVPNQVIHRP